MTQNTPVEILPGYFYVPIPEDANSMEVQDNPMEKGEMIMYLRGVPDYACEYIFLPFPGSFTILFTRDEATEEKWKGVVECDEDGELCNNYHRVHEGSTMVFCATATESGASLLRSHNLPVEDNFVIVKR